MGGWGGELTGVKQVEKKLYEAKLSVPQTLEAALKISSRLVIAEARLILEDEIYSRPRREDEYELTRRLYKSFRAGAIDISGAVAMREIRNTAPYAVFLELGTTAHRIEPKNALALHWHTSSTSDIYAWSKGHDVSGIVAMEFMARAIRNTRAAVEDVFAAAFRNIGVDENQIFRLSAASLGGGAGDEADDFYASDDSYEIELHDWHRST